MEDDKGLGPVKTGHDTFSGRSNKKKRVGRERMFDRR